MIVYASGSEFWADDLSCTAETIQKANREQLGFILENINNQTFFRLFPAQLDGKCPLDPPGSVDEPSCGTVPAMNIFDISSPPQTKPQPALCSVNIETVDTFLSVGESDAVILSEQDCEDENLPTFWTNLCTNLPFEDSGTEYINLQLNQEQFTGYNGTAVWHAVYNECRGKFGNHSYESRILLRLLSGLHASINLHIAHQYYPPIQGKRDSWEPNVKTFKKHFVGHPGRFKNLQFAFVVLLRAIRKATPVLSKFKIHTGSLAEDARTQSLVNHFLDSYVLNSCQDVFEAFDESLLFHESSKPTSVLQDLKRQFKDVFKSVSSLFNCVKCQKCRLHGKLQLLGIGTALKFLLVPTEVLQKNISREEVVALFNTLGKFSESLQIHEGFLAEIGLRVASADVRHSPTKESLLDMVAAAGFGGTISPQAEDALVDAVLDQNQELYQLARAYAVDQPTVFLRHAIRRLHRSSLPQIPDALIIGAGISGLTAAVSILERGGTVVVIDKEAIAGGNSAKASSGINGLDDYSIATFGDSVELFKNDMWKERTLNTSELLVDVLTKESVSSLKWLRTFMTLPDVSQLGGHSKPRTWRPSTGLAGSEMVAALNTRFKSLGGKLMSKTKAMRFQVTNGELAGVECMDLVTMRSSIVRAQHVIIATGGFAFDTSNESLLAKYRPDLQTFPTTNGKFATGDGIRMAMHVGGSVVDIDQVQIHPTAFVDPLDRDAKVKTLAAEMLRGIGAIIVNKHAKRFVNELGTRKHVSETMLQQDHKEFLMILNDASAKIAMKHIPLYKSKGLMHEYATLQELSEANGLDNGVLMDTIKEYDRTASDSERYPDPFERTVFKNFPIETRGPFVAGWITPALHYTMGGLHIDSSGRVLDKSGFPLLNNRVFAVGEIMGGIHGKNRLGGNGLTECVVFGRHVGTTIELQLNELKKSENSVTSEQSLRVVSKEELGRHNTEDNLWVLIDGKVYDFTSFARDHPAGPEAISNLAGTDGSDAFYAIHSASLLEDFDPVGRV